MTVVIGNEENKKCVYFVVNIFENSSCLFSRNSYANLTLVSVSNEEAIFSVCQVFPHYINEPPCCIVLIDNRSLLFISFLVIILNSL